MNLGCFELPFNEFRENICGFFSGMSCNYIGAEPERVLKEVFGYDSFRLLQKDIILNVLKGNDTLAIMPTGGGKSLCYQIPALIFEGITVVVSPLISLMQDQVDALVASGVNAVFLNSTLAWENYLDAMNSIRRGEIKIVYVSPEGLSSQKIFDLLSDPRVKLSCITIDEAHCVSSWGHDFRTDYLEIASVRRRFSNAVCLALTATATVDVRQDIIKNLALNNPKVLISTFNRPNIFLDVRPRKKVFEQILECIRRHWDESGIIYCFSRRQVDELTQMLRKSGYSALPYHAGLSDEERKRNQQLFIRDQIQIIVATVAFGMGIDKPNVRFVIHHDLPRSLEQYYQEIGRAGRDGLACEAVLLYSNSDIFKIRRFFTEAADPENSERLLQAMIDYAGTSLCRRKKLLAYFDEVYEPSKENSIQECCCDICRLGPAPIVDMTVPAQKFLSCIIRTNSRFGQAYVTDVLLGSSSKKILDHGHEKLSTWGIGGELSKGQWLNLCERLIEHNFIIKTGDYGVLSLTQKGIEFLRNRSEFKIPFDLTNRNDFETKKSYPQEFSQSPFVPRKYGLASANGGILFPKPSSSKAKVNKNFDSLDSHSAGLALALKKWRKKTAEEMNVPPYVVFGDKTLFDIIEKKPRSIDELMSCHGIGESKAQKFGQEIITCVEKYLC